MNVLVYYGDKTAATNRPEYLASLRQILFPKYAVAPVASDTLLNEPWAETCALLVISGDDYLDLCRRMGQVGTARIKDFVRSGGAFLGINAGAYYGSQRCTETHSIGEQDDNPVEQSLGFFPGECRGPYTRRAIGNANVAEIIGADGHSFQIYGRGDGAFFDAAKFDSDRVNVIARFALDGQAESSSEERAAIVYCREGQGACVLVSGYLEMDPRSLPLDSIGSDDLYIALLQDDESRMRLLRHCVSSLGLEVNTGQGANPSLSTIHLTSASRSLAAKLNNVLANYMQGTVARDDHDTFCFERQPDSSQRHQDNPRSVADADQGVNDSTAKHITIYDEGFPSVKATPLFDHDVFFTNLSQSGNLGPTGDVWFGNHLLYGEVMESTNTILAKNHTLLHALPTGFTALASLQTAGRGRGSNVWVSPVGCLLFSTCIRHPASACEKSPVVFVQYIAAMAVVEAVKSYAPGYEDFPIHIKWPNDIYIDVPRDAEGHQPQRAKIGGVLVQCSYSGNDYFLVAGIGLNTTNASPTTSLRYVSDQLNIRRVGSGLDLLESVSLEKLLARILQAFERLYMNFRLNGWGDSLDDLYVRYWLHTGQIVTVDSASGRPRGRIVGIDNTSADLLVEELGKDDHPTGHKYKLSPDGNSFDFFHGLLKKKE